MAASTAARQPAASKPGFGSNDANAISNEISNEMTIQQPNVKEPDFLNEFKKFNENEEINQRNELNLLSKIEDPAKIVNTGGGLEISELPLNLDDLEADPFDSDDDVSADYTFNNSSTNITNEKSQDCQIPLNFVETNVETNVATNVATDEVNKPIDINKLSRNLNKKVTDNIKVIKITNILKNT